MKTTLEIPDELFKQVKVRAAQDGLKLKEVVASALNSYLTQPHAAPGESKPCPFPLIRGRGKWKMPDLTPGLLAKLTEEEDIERYHKSIGR